MNTKKPKKGEVEKRLYPLVINNQLSVGIATVLSKPDEIERYLKKCGDSPQFDILEHVVERDKFFQDINQTFRLFLERESFDKCQNFTQLVKFLQKITNLS